MTLKIISDIETVFEGDVQSVTLPGAQGSFTVLRNHASLISTLDRGTIHYRPSDGGDQLSVPVSGGLVDVDNNIISVCIY